MWTRLKPAWIFHTGDVSDGTRWPTRSAFEATPLVVDGVMYVTTPFSRLIALEAETGKELWAFDPRMDRTESANLFINRGAAYWTDGTTEAHFPGHARWPAVLDRRRDRQAGRRVRQRRAGSTCARAWPTNFRTRIGMTSPPAVYKNLVICGSLVPDGEPRGPAGDVRAFDARTGKLVWTFHTVAQGGEFGNDTWAPGSWQNRGGVERVVAVSAWILERGISFCR